MSLIFNSTPNPIGRGRGKGKNIPPRQIFNPSTTCRGSGKNISLRQTFPGATKDTSKNFGRITKGKDFRNSENNDYNWEDFQDHNKNGYNGRDQISENYRSRCKRSIEAMFFVLFDLSCLNDPVPHLPHSKQLLSPVVSLCVQLSVFNCSYMLFSLSSLMFHYGAC